ncbi:SigE family RNA polymerase sigma factor [Longispora sp. NPDC051575]|uniref:SigE family RNA polymerase sigma factor n=1 Tax=Longispora sp. NPDC051575 TaxID=3154943 RepID=UPI0034346C03
MTGSTGFDEYVATRSPRLLRLAYLLTQDHALAEDLVQTALVKSWPAWGRIADDPEPYVRRVLTNTFNSWWRRRSRGERPTAVLPDRRWTTPHGEVDDRDEVWRALAQLPRQQRAVLVLRYLEDLSEAETADALGVSVGSVKGYASKGLAKLRLDPALRPFPEPEIPPGGDGRVSAVRDRIGRRRRGRLAVAGAACALVVAVLVGYVLARGRTEALPPTGPSPTPSVAPSPSVRVEGWQVVMVGGDDRTLTIGYATGPFDGGCRDAVGAPDVRESARTVVVTVRLVEGERCGSGEVKVTLSAPLAGRTVVDGTKDTPQQVLPERALPVPGFPADLSLVGGTRRAGDQAVTAYYTRPGGPDVVVRALAGFGEPMGAFIADRRVHGRDAVVRGWGGMLVTSWTEGAWSMEVQVKASEGQSPTMAEMDLVLAGLRW